MSGLVMSDFSSIHEVLSSNFIITNVKKKRNFYFYCLQLDNEIKETFIINSFMCPL